MFFRATQTDRSVHVSESESYSTMLIKSASQSLSEQISGRIAERIRTRLLAPGAKLPSVRLCAEQQGVSPSTVVAAYDQLLAQGLVEAQKNRGFYVRALTGT